MDDKKNKIKYDDQGNVIANRPNAKEAELDTKQGIMEEKNPDDFDIYE
ncbi:MULTISPECIES: hypothetical protein [Bacillus]|nr:MULTISPECIES: hypothetical protein [Bacillus]